MPKHVILGMSLRHLTGSAEVVSIINRYGHCHSYSKLLELETSLAYQAQLSDTILPANISPVYNAVTHQCFDNFNLLEETKSGSGTWYHHSGACRAITVCRRGQEIQQAQVHVFLSTIDGRTHSEEGGTSYDAEVSN